MPQAVTPASSGGIALRRVTALPCLRMMSSGSGAGITEPKKETSSAPMLDRIRSSVTGPSAPPRRLPPSQAPRAIEAGSRAPSGPSDAPPTRLTTPVTSSTAITFSELGPTCSISARTSVCGSCSRFWRVSRTVSDRAMLPAMASGTTSQRVLSLPAQSFQISSWRLSTTHSKPSSPRAFAAPMTTPTSIVRLSGGRTPAASAAAGSPESAGWSVASVIQGLPGSAQGADAGDDGVDPGHERDDRPEGPAVARQPVPGCARGPRRRSRAARTARSP